METMELDPVINTSPFAELPAALVEEVLVRTEDIAGSLVDAFSRLKAERKDARQRLQHAGLLRRKADLGAPPYPTTCATDGSYAIERLLTSDLVATAAVAVEGLTPPSETRHWAQPHYQTYVAAEPHSEETATILRALMLGYELELAVNAPHDLVLLDGSFSLPIIYFNQALNAAPVSRLRTATEFLERAEQFLTAYKVLLSAQRNDKQIAALPKYTTRREVSTYIGWSLNHDDRGLLTHVLDPGEFTAPLPLETPESPWHLHTSSLPSHVRERAEALANQIVDLLGQVRVFYYKPHSWIPALRVEVGSSIASNPHRLSIVLQGLDMQCTAASMLEPYPNYLADRMVKALARALPAFRQITTQRVAEQFSGEIGDVFLAMHGYRSDSGRK
jgi:hypothetical protein